MQQLLQRIMFYGVCIQFILVVFCFSYLPYLLGSDLHLSLFSREGYEGIKATIVTLFLVFYPIWFFFYFLVAHKNKKNRKVIFGSLLLIFLVLLSTVLGIYPSGAFWGLSEKFHGTLYFVSLIGCFLGVFLSFGKKEYYAFIELVMWVFLAVFGYAFIQQLGLDPLAQFYQSRVSLDRSISFLGNANYLAGLSLMIMPFTQMFRKDFLKWGLLGVCILTLIFSGGYIAIFLGILYLMIHFLWKKKVLFIFALVSLILGVGYIAMHLPTEKLGSLISRFYMWETAVNIILDSPMRLLFGYGPDTLHLLFDQFKSSELNVFETSTYTADRTHNIFLDLIYYFGILGGGLMIYFLLRAITLVKDIHIRHSMILFFVFFSFNIPVSVHFLIVCILVAGAYKKVI